MKSKTRLVIVALIAAAGAVVSCGLAMPHWPLSVLYTPGTSDEALIRRTMDVFLVPPSWLGLQSSMNGDGIGRWLIAETGARFTIICALWAALPAVFWVSARRSARRRLAEGLRHGT